ncbi:MAG TPA: UDP-glucuronic acid decarboxylase family protein [Chloroflexota bacterium]|nr:UDP-glucuronic acid decarboxylase family protein [Chloroflexota bacterium]
MGQPPLPGESCPLNTLVSGGAGFIGSHLCEALLDAGHQVICVDNLLTGRSANIETLLPRSGFTFVQHDIIEPLPADWPVEAVFNLASPASPVGYFNNRIATARVNSEGTFHLLELATRHRAMFLQASTSEVYGEPEVHPQTEDYWGNVNPHGPRACYDEGKRYAEALTMDFHRVYDLDVRLIRIFNTYGPRSQPDDGRVVPNFICNALRGEPLPIYGAGSKTRSYCYVADLVQGILKAQFTKGTTAQVFNLGNPDEFTLDELAQLVLRLTGSSSSVEYLPDREDDPSRRRPDISRARSHLGWEPLIPLEQGLGPTIDWFRSQLGS